MQHDIPRAGDPDALRLLSAKFEGFVERQTGEVQASLLAFLHLVEANDLVQAEFSIAPDGDLHLAIAASRARTSARRK